MTAVDISDLPHELLGLIATFLESPPVNICPFRLVCKTWLEAADAVIVTFGVTYVARAAGEPNSAAVLGRLPALQHLTMRGVRGGGGQEGSRREEAAWEEEEAQEEGRAPLRAC